MTRLPLSVMMLANGLSAGGFGLVAKAQDLPPDDAANGRARQGAAYNGPAPALAKTVVPFEGFKMQIRNPSNEMPAYSEPVMSDPEIADIYVYM